MIDVSKIKVEKDNILSSLNFMKISDVIFSATMTINDLHKYEIKNYKIINKENNLITFINTNFEIKENFSRKCS